MKDKRSWTPLRLAHFPPPSRVSLLCFPAKDRPDCLGGVPAMFWTLEGRFSGTLSSPHTLCTPHIVAHWQLSRRASKSLFLAFFGQDLLQRAEGKQPSKVAPTIPSLVMPIKRCLHTRDRGIHLRLSRS